MSEPMSSIEIEDVLSSIRRLVSEDLRPLHRPAPTQAALRPTSAERAAPVVVERLILTPALRVVPATDSGTKTVIAALEAAVTAQGDRWESESGDEAPAAASATLDWDDAPWDETIERARRDLQDQAPAALILETIRTALPEESATGSTNAAADLEGNFGDSDSWGQVAGHEPDAVNAPDLPKDLDADPVWFDQAEAEVLASLAVGVGAEATADTNAAGPDIAEPLADQNPDISDVFTSRRTMPRMEAADEGDITFDEEVLRDLVRDLIREELQGALGERITRNVRKLVRAEIARTIAAQTYE